MKKTNWVDKLALGVTGLTTLGLLGVLGWGIFTQPGGGPIGIFLLSLVPISWALYRSINWWIEP